MNLSCIMIDSNVQGSQLRKKH